VANCVTIPLTAGKHAVVDACDLALVSAYRWYAVRSKVPSTGRHRGWYAMAKHAGKTIYMHRVVMGEPAGQVDHKDNDGLNNTRLNLRAATASQNGANKDIVPAHGYRGISPHGHKWRVSAGRGKEIGSFATPEEAARAYDAAAFAKWGEFARLNFKAAA
jgi:hypothetical protein